MQGALWTSKTGLSAQDANLRTISNNLANASTVGFKRDRTMFEDLMYQIQRQPGAQNAQDAQLPSGLQLGTGVRVVGTQKDFTEGSMQVTEQSLDMAINGRGFLQVLLPNGQTAYTRNGQLQLNSDGALVNSEGYLLQPAITLPTDTQTVTIGKDGTVSVSIAGQNGVTQIGNITTTDFVNPAGLQALGGNLFQETASSGSPQSGTPGQGGLGTLEQGTLEGSNVDVVNEMVNMITTQRVYEMNSKVLKTADDMLGFIVQNT